MKIIPNALQGEFIFFLYIDEDDPDESYLSVSTRRVWDKTGYCNDHFTDKESLVIEQLRNNGFDELGIGTYDLPQGWDRTRTRQFLLSNNFVEDEAYTRFLSQ